MFSPLTTLPNPVVGTGPWSIYVAALDSDIHGMRYGGQTRRPVGEL